MVTDDDQTIDLNDEWNNIASAQSWLYANYPEAKQETIRDVGEKAGLELEWERRYEALDAIR